MLGDDRMELRCGQATALSAILIIVPFLLCAPFVGAGNYYNYASTIGVLALIGVYISVCTAETVEAWVRRPTPGTRSNPADATAARCSGWNGRSDSVPIRAASVTKIPASATADMHCVI